MAIQPIDLQTMYSQISNVARNEGSQQLAAQVGDISKQQTMIRQNQENLTKVQQTNQNANANSVNANGHNQNQEKNKNRNSKKSESDEQIIQNDYREKNPYLGTIIDITR